MEPGTHISIVDDDELDLEACREALDGAVYDVSTYRCVSQLLEKRCDASSGILIVEVRLWQDLAEAARTAILARYPLIISGRADLLASALASNPEAEDFIAKPFHPLELVARIERVLRRAAGQPVGPEDGQHVRFAEWTFDTGTLHLMADDGRRARLTSAEAGLLTALISAPHRILTRDQLLQSNPLGDEGAFERSIDVLISRLRKKLEMDIRNPRIIRTVYGAGYSFSCEAKWSGSRNRR